MTATLNGVRVVEARVWIPARGAWFADLDVDPDNANQVASIASATLSILGANMKCTVDPRGSGRFVSSYRFRVVGGAGGWDKPVPRFGYHNDAGVTSRQIYQATAVAVGEVVNDSSPVTYGPDFLQETGPASQVFIDRKYYVDFNGVTQVAEWPSSTPDASTQILSYDADQKRIELSSDAMILPGMSFTDSRFDGTLIARDIEIKAGPENARITVWCSDVAVTRAVSALVNMTRAFAGVATLRSYRYRVISQGVDGRVVLQAVNPSLGAPDIGPISIWSGTQGDTALVALSSECDVHMQEGDRSLAVVASWAPGTLPTTRTVDASSEVDIGPTAPIVKLGGGAKGVARVGDPIDFSNAMITSPPGGGECTITPINVLKPALSIRTGSSKVFAT